MPTLLDNSITVCAFSANWVGTPLGRMLAVAGDEGLVQLEFIEDDEDMSATAAMQEANTGQPNRHLSQLADELTEYFAGTRTEFSVPLAPKGTEFEMRAWDYLRTIPYGQTRNYGQQARAIGQANASRAVGRANGMNRIGIVIPCHRVIGSDGKLTGFAAGIERKRWLLNHEQNIAGGNLFR